jgi:CheY-like chemotaxis protein
VRVAKSILLAEDFEDDARSLVDVLKASGIQNPIIRVGDGDEALAYLKGEGLYGNRQNFPLPGLLLLDLKMPRVDGFQVLEWIQTQPELKNMLVVVLSGHNDLKDVKHAYALGAHTFLIKPFKLEDVANLTASFSTHLAGLVFLKID